MNNYAYQLQGVIDRMCDDAKEQGFEAGWSKSEDGEFIVRLEKKAEDKNRCDDVYVATFKHHKSLL